MKRKLIAIGYELLIRVLPGLVFIGSIFLMVLWGLRDGGSNGFSVFLMILAILSLIVTCIMMVPFIMSWVASPNNVIRIGSHSFAIFNHGNHTTIRENTDAGLGYAILVFFLLIITFPYQLIRFIISTIVILISEKEPEIDEDNATQAFLSVFFLVITLVLSGVANIPVAVYSSKTKPIDTKIYISDFSVYIPPYSRVGDINFTFNVSHKSEQLQSIDGFLIFEINDFSYNFRCNHLIERNGYVYTVRSEDVVFLNYAISNYSDFKISYNVTDLIFKKRTYKFDYLNQEKSLVLPVQKYVTYF